LVDDVIDLFVSFFFIVMLSAPGQITQTDKAVYNQIS